MKNANIDISTEWNGPGDYWWFPYDDTYPCVIDVDTQDELEAWVEYCDECVGTGMLYNDADVDEDYDMLADGWYVDEPHRHDYAEIV